MHKDREEPPTSSCKHCFQTHCYLNIIMLLQELHTILFAYILHSITQWYTGARIKNSAAYHSITQKQTGARIKYSVAYTISHNSIQVQEFRTLLPAQHYSIANQCVACLNTILPLHCRTQKQGSDLQHNILYIAWFLATCSDQHKLEFYLFWDNWSGWNPLLSNVLFLLIFGSDESLKCTSHKLRLPHSDHQAAFMPISLLFALNLRD